MCWRYGHADEHAPAPHLICLAHEIPTSQGSSISNLRLWHPSGWKPQSLAPRDQRPPIPRCLHMQPSNGLQPQKLQQVGGWYIGQVEAAWRCLQPFAQTQEKDHWPDNRIQKPKTHISTCPPGHLYLYDLMSSLRHLDLTLNKRDQTEKHMISKTCAN